MDRLRVLLSACLVASLAGCCTICRKPVESSPGTPAEARASIVGTLQRLIAADNARDLEAVLACYSDDVTWLPPGEPPVSGKDAVRARYGKLFAGYHLDFTIEIAEAHADGLGGSAWGTTHGALTPVGGGDAVPV